MARYRPKSDEEMAWNAIRRAATAQVRLEAAAWAERRLNDILPPLQVEFRQMIQDGNLPELDVDYKTWVKEAVRAMKGLPEADDDPPGSGS